MTKREKIIVTIMVLVVLWGAYEVFLVSPEEAAETPGDVATVVEKTPDGASQFITDIVKKLPPREKIRRNQLVIEKAGLAWQKDPFIPMEIIREDAPAIAKGDQAGDLFIPGISYSGFLQVGGRRLAVINGLEYEIDEIIEPGTYVLKQIFQDRVVIASVSGRKTFTVLLEEADAFPAANRK